MNNILWTAVVTPLHPDGRLHLANFEHLLRMQERAGNGIVILGSTGEGLNLSEEERRKIVTFTSSLELDVPVMCGVGGHDLPSTLAWLRFLGTQRVDAYLMVTPIYAKPGPNGQFAWFSTLLNTATRPCMLYNVPSRTGTSLSFEAVSRLASHPHFWAIKEASGSAEQFARYVDAGQDIDVYSGDDPLMSEFAPLGATGLVSVASNIWPEATRVYVEMALEGSLSPEDIALWKEASRLLFVTSNPIPVKTILMMEKHIQTNQVKLPLDASDMHSANALLQISRRIGVWLGDKIKIAV